MWSKNLNFKFQIILIDYSLGLIDYLGILLCYKEGSKGFILMELLIRGVFLSRNVSFYEDSFPFIITSGSDKSITSKFLYYIMLFLDTLDDNPQASHKSIPNILASHYESPKSTSHFPRHTP